MSLGRRAVAATVGRLSADLEFVALSWGDRYAKGGGVNREEREA